MFRGSARWALAIVVGVLVAGAGLVGLFRALFDESEINPDVLAAIERDPGFRATPADAQDANAGRRLECRDDSGDSPETYREVAASLDDERLVAFYREVLVAEGWVLNNDVAVAGGAAFSKTVEGHHVDLRVYTPPERGGVTLVARTRCSDH